MKVTDKTLKEKMMPISAIMDGTVFRGSVGSTTSVFLKAYNTIIDLHHPSSTWTVESTMDDSIIAQYEELDAELIVRPFPKKK